MKKFTSLLVSFLFTLLHGQTSFAQAGSGNDLDLNGSSQYVNCGTISLSGSGLTIQGWIKVQAFKTGFPYISSFAGTEQTGHQACVRLGDASIPNNRVQFILYDGSTHHKVHTQTALTTNDWYHIAATFDGSIMKIYINGVVDTTKNLSGNIVSNSTFELGRNYGNGRILNGELDDISVFSTALSETTIRDWMCRKITSAHPDYFALLGYWPLDEGSGSTAYDASINGNDGSIIASPTWKYSGAPIGDRSKHVYASSFNLGLSHPNGDSINVTSTSGTFQGVHLYRIDSVPNETSVPNPLQYLDSGRSWGIFPITEADYDVDYYYNGNPAVGNDECLLAFARRNDNSDDTWSNQPPSSINYTSNVMSFSSSDRNEFSMAISNNGPHTISFTVDEPLCTGDANGSATCVVSGGVAPYSYVWSTSSTTATASNLATGTYYVTVTDDNGCESEDSVFVDEPSIIIASGNTTNSTCADTNNGTASVTATGGVGGYTYAWDDPNNSTTSTVNDLFAGTYNVTITDTNGCTTTGTYTVSSTGPDPMPNLGNDSSICDGISFGLTAGNEGGPFTNFEWSTGGTGGIEIISGPGTYSVTVQNASGCSASDTVSFAYVIAVQVDLGNNNQNGTGSKTLDAGPGFLNYLWSTSANTQSITVSQTGQYWVEVEDSNQCESRDTVNVKIKPAGLSELASAGIKVYPNPTSDILIIENTSNDPITQVGVLSLDGRMVKAINLVGTNIDVTALAAGTYLLRIEKVSGAVYEARLVKD